MHLRSILAAACLAPALLAGCATAPAGAKLTYETRPEGATLYEGGQSIGVAPVMRRYAGDGKGGDIQTPDVTAVWPSGAKTTFFTILKPGDDRVATLQRPANAPNLAVDQANAEKVIEANKKDDERRKAQTLNDVARASARCKAQQAGGTGVIDECQ